MQKIVLTVSLLAASIAMAHADPIADRQALMKSNGRAVGSVAKIAQGQEPFDAAKVMAALKQIDEDAKAFDVEKLFPAGSESGGDTEASPKIWEDRAGFTAAVEKWRADAAAAVAANPQDLASFQTQFKAVTANCGTCHQGYRVKR